MAALVGDSRGREGRREEERHVKTAAASAVANLAESCIHLTLSAAADNAVVRCVSFFSLHFPVTSSVVRRLLPSLRPSVRLVRIFRLSPDRPTDRPSPRVVFLPERNDPRDGRKPSGKLRLLLLFPPLLTSFRRRSRHLQFCT